MFLQRFIKGREHDLAYSITRLFVCDAEHCWDRWLESRARLCALQHVGILFLIQLRLRACHKRQRQHYRGGSLS